MKTRTAPQTTSVVGADNVVDLMRDLSRLTSRRDILEVLADRLPALLPVCDRVSMAFVDDSEEGDAEGDHWLRFYRLFPLHPEVDLDALPRVKRDGTPVGQTVIEGAPRVVADVRADRNITFGHAAKDSIRSTISVPIFVAGRTVGAFNTGSTRPHACDEEMVQQVQDVAAVVGPAMWAAEAREGLRGAAKPRPQTPRSPSSLHGESDAFRRLMERAARAAKSDANILITGETGVGKTALARVIHRWSQRAQGPFVTTHLGALSPSLVESEMFGHERGAFTGASQRRIGRFESAMGGTLFIDELGDTPLEVQAKMLRVVQEGEFERVGGNRSIQTDARLITATNHDLDAAVKEGRFRADLLHRLNVLPLHVPPLRERGGDVEVLAEAILEQLRQRLHRPLRLSALGLRRLRTHAWPGNIRELQTSLERAAALEPADALDLSDLDAQTHPRALPFGDVVNGGATTEDQNSPRSDWPSMKEHQRRYLQRVLAHTAGVIEGEHGAAKLLDMRPSTLRSQLQRLGLSSKGPRSAPFSKGEPA